MRISNLILVSVVLLGANACRAESIKSSDEYINIPVPEIVFHSKELAQVFESLCHVSNNFSVFFTPIDAAVDLSELPEDIAKKEISIGFKDLTFEDALNILAASYGLSFRITGDSKAPVVVIGKSRPDVLIRCEFDYELIDLRPDLKPRYYIKIKNQTDLPFEIYNTFKGAIVYERIGLTWSKSSALQEMSNPELVTVEPGKWAHKYLLHSEDANAFIVSIVVEGQEHWFFWEQRKSEGAIP